MVGEQTPAQIGAMKNDWTELVDLLRRAGMEFTAGLTDFELDRAEAAYGFRFPADLRSFLQTATPMYYDWHAEEDARIREALALPLEGILFDVAQGFWLPEWGRRPGSLDEANAIVMRLVEGAPRLIPIYAHRMMPDRPSEAGNPIFSVHQTDIIYYSFNLDDYLRNEFNLPGRKSWPATVRQIDFWDIDRFQQYAWQDWVPLSTDH